MVLDTSLLNTQHYNVRIKSNVEQSRVKEEPHPLHLGVVAIEKGAFWSPSTKGRQLYFIFKSCFSIFLQYISLYSSLSFLP